MILLKSKIYIAMHKDYWKTSNEIYCPIEIGAIKHKNKFLLCRDDIGENISEKNNTYCELTALYWIWKNDISSEIIGLTHYRRYFNFIDKNIFYLNRYIGINRTKDIEMYINVNEKQLKKILEENDIILPKPWYTNVTLREHYNREHYECDFDMLEIILKNKYPEYSNSFDVVVKRNYMYLLNMFIVKRDIFMDYMKWLFDILEELEKHIKISNDRYQSRTIGFIAERLINVYVYHNNLKVKELPIIFIDEKDKNINRPKFIGYRACLSLIRNLFNKNK